ncbi:J domain-containing protein [Mediterraneibacter agrestimuris]|uniref:J domain-containing protein n=1 Tax=Mediterraneibacter agrestimuris TaxID=2941333 RepID=UPI00203EED92|nr:DnaJ domain-containing protein [Mediterraneibacter agrestimuris]
MAIRTYYHILGVSRDAAPEEITAAKNALAKIYHPDANMSSGVDTTLYMQEILEAYHILSDPEKRAKYDKKISGGTNRVFRTFTMSDPESAENETSFVTYWAAAGKLNEIVTNSIEILEQESQKVSLTQKILNRLGKSSTCEKELNTTLKNLSIQALSHITILKNAEIPMDYWQSEAMNWVLIHWSQNQTLDYHTLFAQYDAFINQNKSSAERLKLRAQNKQFHHQLKRLLTYAL